MYNRPRLLNIKKNATNKAVLAQKERKMQRTDYLNLWSSLTEEERMMSDTARKFIDEQWLTPKDGKKEPLAIEYTRAKCFPRELVPRMADLGYLGITIPQQYGGQGVSPIGYGLVAYELERGDSGLRSFMSVTNSLVGFSIYSFGSEEQKQTWLPPLCRGERIGCFGLTASEGGSNPEGNPGVIAKKNGASFILNGEKHWITNATECGIAIVWAQYENKLRGFLVPRETEGFSQYPIQGKLSLYCSDTGTLAFSNCIIPEENLLPGTMEIPCAYLRALNEARYGIIWGMAGMASDCYETALTYAKERAVFNGRAIAEHQIIQLKLERMLEGVTNCQQMAFHLGRLKERGELRHPQISMGKRHNCETAETVALIARKILGAAGITDEFSPMRHFINVQSVGTYEGTDEIHTLVVGRDITGIDAFE